MVASFFNVQTLLKTILPTEAVVQRSSVEKVFSEISQNLQESICARVFF